VPDVLDIMKHHGLRQVQSTYRACLQACFDARNAESASEILEAMKHAGVEADPTDVGLAVTTMCRNEKRDRGWLDKALAIVKKTDNLPIAAYDAVFSCLSDEHEWKEAVRLLRRMEASNGTKPVVSTYRYVIEACVGSAQPEQAAQVLQSCIDQGLTPTLFSFELLIVAFSKKLNWRRAMRLLDMMDDLKVPKTVVCCNSVLSALSRAREVVHANNLLAKMRKGGIEPDIRSYNAVLAAAASTGRWKDALSVLDQCHRAPGVTPDIYTYTAGIRALGKGALCLPVTHLQLGLASRVSLTSPFSCFFCRGDDASRAHSFPSS